jgi:hypothetical protein
VAGAGGYYNLHAVDAKHKKSKKSRRIEHSDATLMSYNDTEYGYLQMSVSATVLTGNYITVGGKVFDTFTVTI